MYTELLSQAIGIPAAGISPASQAAGTYTTSAVDLGDWPQVEFRLDVGAISTGGTVDFQIVGSATSGSSYTPITGTAITRLTEAGGDSNKTVTVCVTAEKINSLGMGYRFIKGQLVTATAAALAGVSIRGKDQHFGPASLKNDVSVAQQVLFFR